jgi:hypothetical protein
VNRQNGITTIWKESLYEVGPLLTGKHVYKPCLKKKATKYSSRKSHTSKCPEKYT